MFCVECGKETTIYKNGACISCYLKNKTFSLGPLVIDIIVCTGCQSYKYKNTWIEEPFDAVLLRCIKDEFTINNELQNVDITTTCDNQERIRSCKVTITGKISDQTITEEHPLTVRIKRATCELCSRQYGGYYEATIQIRADKRKFSKQELETMKKHVEKLIETMRTKGNRGLFITESEEIHGGLDFNLSEKGSAYSIAKKIYEHYGGEIKQSSKNVGMKDCIQLYRMTYLIRLPAYQKGDFISYNNTFYMISSLAENTVHVVNLADGTKNVFEGKKLEDATVLGGKELIKEMIFVSQSPTEIQIMNPKTYEIIYVKKPKHFTIDEEKIKVIWIDDRVFLLPEKI